MLSVIQFAAFAGVGHDLGRSDRLSAVCELRSGDIAVAGSDSYANLHDQLMTWEECRPLADAFCAQAGIPSDPAALTAHYRSLLASTAARVDAGYPSNTDLVLEGDRPVSGAAKASTGGRKRCAWRLPSMTGCRSGPCWTSSPARPTCWAGTTTSARHRGPTPRSGTRWRGTC